MRSGVRVLACLMGVGCSDGTGPSDSPEGRVPAGWGQVVAERPDDVLGLLAADEDGWAAYHRGDLPAAVQASAEVSRRALGDVIETQAVLVELHGEAATALARTWARRAGLPEGTALHTWAALAAADAGLPTADLLALAPPPKSDDWAALHLALVQGTDVAELAEVLTGPLAVCVKAHVKARSSQAAVAAEACPEPFLEEADGARMFANPLAMRTAFSAGVIPPLDAEALSSRLFSPAWSPEDVRDPAGGPTAEALGLTGCDTPDDALAQVLAATVALDAWRPSSDAPGARLFDDLDVVGIYRAQLLTDWALSQVSTPAAAHEAFRAMLDADSGRGIGPTHPPRMLAGEALAAVRAGHVRSALPPLRALAPLDSVLTELPALTELVNDLQVASTLGRSGDSKEP